ncbi:MAG: hypothetical protein JW797_07535 [Bradymonadales bacterium]|nr:hypothetical protein [Bradymonadales bacterium]
MNRPFPLSFALSLWFVMTACNPEPPSDRGEPSDPSAAGEPHLAPVIDQEPNDRPQQAGLLVDGGTGQLVPGDVDLYRPPQEPGFWRIEGIPGGTGGLRLDAVSAGALLPDSLTTRSTLFAVRGQSDDLVAIRGSTAAAMPYRIRLTPALLPEDLPVLGEPNDLNHPLPLRGIPAAVLGFYEGGGDSDSIEVPASALRSTPAITLEVSPLPSARPMLRLYTPERVLVAEIGAEREGQGVAIPNLGPPESHESWLLELVEAEGAAVERPYTVSFYQAAAAGQRVELEPNDAPAYAMSLGGDPSELTGFFHTPQDRDLFRLEVSTPSAGSVVAAPDGETDLALIWTPPDGVPLVLDFGGVGEAESFCSRPMGAGVHTIEVSPRQSRGLGLATYSLRTRLETGDVELEPNDNPNQPTLQPISRSMRGYIDPETDVDCFSWRTIPPIDTRAAQRVEIQPPTEIDVALEVLDSEGLQVAVADRNRQGGLERITLGELPAGTYRLVVRGRGGASCDLPYTLTIH